MVDKVRTKFRSVVSVLAEDIRTGALKPGDKLPTHRELAYQHGLSLGTATKVFAELNAMGLTVAETGRGTYVRKNADQTALDFGLSGPLQHTVDFSRNHLILPEQKEIFAKATVAVLQDQDCDILAYRKNAGAQYDRIMAWNWINQDREHALASADFITLCNGGQHALLLCLLASCQPGQIVAVERYTYPVIRLVCEMLRLETITVDSDAHGIIPEALDRLCAEVPVHLLFCMPNIQNPTSVTLSENRRRKIAAILKKRNLLAIEDDAYGFLLSHPPVSLSELAPEHVFYVRTLSKSWAPGLRVCYLASPPDLQARIEKAQRASIWMPTPFMGSLASWLLETGHYEAVVRAKRREIKKRQAIVNDVFSGYEIQTSPESMHMVIPLPKGTRTSPFLEALAKDHIVASPITQFVASEDARIAPHGIRLCIGATENRTIMKEAILKIRNHLQDLNEDG